MHYAILAGLVIGSAVSFSLLWQFPYVFTLILFSFMPVFGHLITFDEDLKGGWANPDGDRPFPTREFALKVALFLFFCALAFIPSLRKHGGAG